MSLASSIASRIRSVVRIAKLSYNKASGRGVIIEFNDRSNIAGKFDALATAVASGAVQEAILEEIAKVYVEQLGIAASEINSSGQLAASFSYRNQGIGSVSITSDSPYSRSWLPDGNEGRPPVSNLMDWMSRTSTFSSMDEKEMKRVAFAIQRASITKVGLGSTGLSRLSLSADGKRIYDYRKKAHEAVAIQVAAMGVPFREVL